MPSGVSRSPSSHSFRPYRSFGAIVVWSVRCKNYVNNDVSFNFQSFDVIFEDSGNKFAL